MTWMWADYVAAATFGALVGWLVYAVAALVLGFVRGTRG